MKWIFLRQVKCAKFKLAMEYLNSLFLFCFYGLLATGGQGRDVHRPAFLARVEQYFLCLKYQRSDERERIILIFIIINIFKEWEREMVIYDKVC